MLWLYFLLLVLILVAYKLVVEDWYLEYKKCGIPGPLGYPVIYNYIEVAKNKDVIFDHLLSNTIKFGRTWSARYPLLPRYVYTVDPACVDYVLSKNFKNYIKGPEFQFHLKDVLGDGIFNTNGSAWKRQRQIASYLFSTKAVKNMEPVFLKHCGFLINRLHSICQSAGSHPDSLSAKQPNQTATSPTLPIIDIQEVFQRFALDSIGEILFGTNVNSMNNNEILFPKAFTQCLLSIDSRFSIPGWNYMPFLPSEKKLRAAIMVCDQFAYSLIDEHEKDPELATRPDLLSRYMSHKDEDEKPFSRKYLRDIIMNFLIAGRDSSAQTMTWIFYLLSQNLEQQEKLIEEIDTLLEGEEPTLEKIKNMQYLKGVVDEALRIFPPIPVDPKHAVEDDVFPDGTIIKKGYTVEWSAWLMGRHPDFWENPMEFRPERWVTPENNGGKPLPNHTPPFIPFQYGPRLCIGQQMAYFEVKVGMCLLLQNFRLKLVPGQTIIPMATVSLSAKNGVRMFVEPRDPSEFKKYTKSSTPTQLSASDDD